MSNENMLDRQIKPAAIKVETFDPEQVGDDPVAWLEGHLQDGMVLLAHADDGVVWGKVQADSLEFPEISDFEQAEWRSITLQMARLFDETSELFVWRVEERSWCARQISERPLGEQIDLKFRACFDEQQILWGTGVSASHNGFSLLYDGEQQMHHAPPIGTEKVNWQQDRCVRLSVRHYLQEDEDTGWLRIGLSRLADVKEESK